MIQQLKDSLKIILTAYKEDKLTEEDVFTVLDSIINNSNNGGSTVISYPYPVYPNYPTNPWDKQITWETKPYCTTTTNTAEFNQYEGQNQTNVTD